jgi:hypothetical protein
LQLSKSQYEFLTDTITPLLAYVGGMGTGKSLCGALKALDLAQLNPGHIGIVWSPTISDAKDNIMRVLIEVLQGDHESGIHFPYEHDYNRTTGRLKVKIPGHNKWSEMIVRSSEQNIVGTNAAWVVADEIDTIAKIRAYENVKQLIQRVRAPGSTVKQIAFTTTPEGYNWAWEFFVRDVEANPELKQYRRLIQASLLENAHIDDDYIANLMASHTENEIKARVFGQFVNMKTGAIYSFDRKVHHTSYTVEEYKTADLHVGMDFNIGRMAAVIGVFLPDRLLVVDEMIGTKDKPIRDTPALIKLLKDKYGNRTIYVYPDASGDSNNANGWETCLDELKRAGFKVIHDAKNPPVERRVTNVNRALTAVELREPNSLHINTGMCPLLTLGIEQQSYDEAGKIIKDNVIDHGNDALGYLVMGTLAPRIEARLRASPFRR